MIPVFIMRNFTLHLGLWALVLSALTSAERCRAQSEEVAMLTTAEGIPAALPDAPSFVLQQEGAIQSSGEREAQETEDERKARLHAQAQKELEGQVQQRIMTVVPNFNTVISGRAVPLSKGQKTVLALHSTFDPFNGVGAFVLAGFSEIAGTHRGYGWGAEGYFKRVGANAADIVDGTMLAGAVYPILLHQDPRFFRKGSGTIRTRVRHALLGAFICRGDNGKRQPNYSNVLGNFSAGLISNVYYPSDETGIGLSLVNSSVVTLEGALGNLALEFSPDVSRWWRERRHPKVP
ncbi:hypothetical protein [Granulicella sp. dw_53]|uniref:hypothetical protein n=1 Tax=Granulicella sp. dw_53 TaxID=2719792 RepID=UPI001BD3AE8A|nr:hypothetical protein [Granulicella sp. dw_53]